MKAYNKPSMAYLSYGQSVILTQYSFGLNFTPCPEIPSLFAQSRIEDGAYTVCGDIDVNAPTQEELDAATAALQSQIGQYNIQLSCQGDDTSYQLTAVSGQYVYGSPCGVNQVGVVIQMEFTNGAPSGDCAVTQFVIGDRDLCSAQAGGGDLVLEKRG